MSRATSDPVTYDATGDFAFQSEDAGGDDGPMPRGIKVTVDADSANGALVRVRGLHSTIHRDNEFASLAPGDSVEFTGLHRSLGLLLPDIRDIFIKGNGGDADVSHFVTMS